MAAISTPLEAFKELGLRVPVLAGMTEEAATQWVKDINAAFASHLNHHPNNAQKLRNARDVARRAIERAPHLTTPAALVTTLSLPLQTPEQYKQHLDEKVI